MAEPIGAYVRGTWKRRADALADPYLAEAIARIVPVLLTARARRTGRSSSSGTAAAPPPPRTSSSTSARRRSAGDGRRFRCVALVDNVETRHRLGERRRVLEGLLRAAADARRARAMSRSGSAGAATPRTCCERWRSPARWASRPSGSPGWAAGSSRELVDIPVVVPSQLDAAHRGRPPADLPPPHGLPARRGAAAARAMTAPGPGLHGARGRAPRETHDASARRSTG